MIRTANSGSITEQQGRLESGPAPVKMMAAAGIQSISTGAGRDALLFVPDSYDVSRPAPLAVMLHGAGGNAKSGLNLLHTVAQQQGIILLAPASRKSTWDVIQSENYGPDTEAIDQALYLLFSQYAIDPAHVAIGGFSDGASYALSVGLMNGDLFSHIIAFSPGFTAHLRAVGKPDVFVSHGTHDAVLPIGPCSRRIVPALRHAGYSVHYDEFEGPHTVPPQIVSRAASWFLTGAGHGLQ